ncbi:hypothetical protein GP486_005410 [Trichoglossum hirsutum]|uniref:Uncharacterized protein n=1 Tax=Trichoglossum hirsutum TaxID=265104 RepID=A0A9P8L971_9PEZI|nr:hypothetical protein GP486_005410 [Trichoglossum hirsutum]
MFRLPVASLLANTKDPHLLISCLVANMSVPIDNDASTSLEETTTQQHPSPIDDDDDEDYDNYDNYDNDDYDNASTASPEEPLPPPSRSMSVARILELYRLHGEQRMREVGSSWIEVPLLRDELEELKEALWQDESLLDYVYHDVQ